MGLNAFMSMTGIMGSARQKHAEGKSVVHGVSGDAVAETDWKSGRPDKGFKYKPLVVTKAVDRATPPLHGVMNLGKVIPRVEIEFWRMPPPGGAEEKYFTIKLTDVYVMSIKTVMYNNQRPEYAMLPLFDEVTLVFDKVEYAYSGADFKSGDKVSSQSRQLTAAFEPPYEAKAKATAVELGKEAGSVLAGDVWKRLRGEPVDPPEEGK